MSDDFWKTMTWDELRRKLKKDPDYLANKEVARRVVLNETVVVNYYLGPMNEHLVNKINFVMGRDVYADFYLFLGHPFDEQTGVPKWHRVSLYDARDCSLKSYTSRIACRYFYKLANKEKKIRELESELLECRDYESLLECDQLENDSDSVTQRRMKRAFETLNERDKKVLQYLVIDKMAGIDAYHLLESFVHPLAKDGLTSDEIKASWTLKQKQDVVSLMKGRALKRLTDKYTELNCNHKDEI